MLVVALVAVAEPLQTDRVEIALSMEPRSSLMEAAAVETPVRVLAALEQVVMVALGSNMVAQAALVAIQETAAMVAATAALMEPAAQAVAVVVALVVAAPLMVALVAAV